MPRKQWHAFSGVLNHVSADVQRIVFEVVALLTGEVVGVADTFSEALSLRNSLGLSSFDARIVRVEENVDNAQSEVILTVPLVPIPIFDRPFKILTTRGFWDVQATTTPAGTAFNFAFGLLPLPVRSVYVVDDHTDPNTGEEFSTFALQSPDAFPDPLLDDAGWFVYESFARVQTDINQDPPFHSKTHRKVPAHSAIVCMMSVNFQVPDPQAVRVSMALRFRMLIEV